MTLDAGQVEATRRGLALARLWRKKLVAQPSPVGRALDQARNVGQDELVVAEPHDAQMRLERGEGIVGDLGLGGADCRDERGLSGIREADQRGIGQQLDLQAEPMLFAVLTLLREPRRPARVRQEPRVSPAPAATAGGKIPVAVADEVGQHLAVARCAPSFLRARRPRGLHRSPRGACCPNRACPMRPDDGDDRGTRATTHSCGRPRGRRHRRIRRRHRRGPPSARGPRVGTTPNPRHHRRRAG